MKKTIFLLLLFVGFSGISQTNDALVKHYQAFYKEMRLQGDVNGVVSALTHLNVLAPSEQRRDTLAFVYMNNGKHMQALNTIGVEKNADDFLYN